MGEGHSKTRVVYKDRPVEKVVYKEPPVPKLLTTPWRKLNIRAWDQEMLNELVQHARNYVPSERVKLANILLLGPIGAGKSSFFNTVQTSLGMDDVIKRRAGVGSDPQSYTRAFQKYKMRSEEVLKFKICDCRGIESANSIPEKDIEAILDGHMEHGYKINPAKAIEDTNKYYKSKPTIQDKIHCIVWCFEADTPYDTLSDDENGQVKDVQEIARRKGIGQLVLLNKIDHLNMEIDSEVQKGFYSSDVKKSVELFAHSFGLPVSSILPMKNYYKEVSRDIGTDILALYNLKQMLSVANDSILNLIDGYDDDFGDNDGATNNLNIQN